MMKKILLWFLFLWGYLNISLSVSSFYNLSSEHFYYVTRISQKAEELIEKKPNIYPKIVQVLEEYRDKKPLSNTIESIINLSIARIFQDNFEYVNIPKIAYITTPEFDTFLWTQEYAPFFLEKYWRMFVFSPFFDEHTYMYPYAWFYKDLYAIYVDQDITNIPENWFLQDEHGEKLYINWWCEVTCPQYAANIFDDTFRAHWVSEAKKSMQQWYRGIWIDDVNMDWRISNQFGENRLPVNRQTEEVISLEQWREAMVVFLQEIRQAFLDDEIVHNALWTAQPWKNNWIEKQIKHSDFINIEHGILDAGLTWYEWTYSLSNFFTFIDSVHQLWKSVLLWGEPTTDTQREYYVTWWYLTQDKKDSLIVQDPTLTPWNTPWKWYGIDMGKPIGNRYIWNNVWRRDFENGSVLLNPPDKNTIELQIQGYDIYGAKFQTIRMPAKSGKMILKDI